MAENPFGATPGETYEEYNNRRLRELNLIRIEAGMPPLRGNAESGAEIQAALDASEEFRTRKETMPIDRMENPEEAQARLIALLRGLGEVGDIGQGTTTPVASGGSPEEPGNVLLRALSERSAMQGQGGAIGIGLPGTEPQGPGALAGVDPGARASELLQMLIRLFTGSVGEDIATPGGDAAK
jgi:hypothetical protein